MFLAQLVKFLNEETTTEDGWIGVVVCSLDTSPLALLLDLPTKQQTNWAIKKRERNFPKRNVTEFSRFENSQCHATVSLRCDVTS